MYALGEEGMSLLKTIAGLRIKNKSRLWYKVLVASPAPSLWNLSFGDACEIYKWPVITNAVYRKEGSGFKQGGEDSHCPIEQQQVPSIQAGKALPHRYIFLFHCHGNSFLF